MFANKITFGYRQNPKGVEPSVWIVLRDAKIATQVSKEEFFETCMHHGCFIENEFFETREECNKEAIAMAHHLGCRFVTPEEFRRLEKEGEKDRVAKAFAKAEKLISLS